MPENTSLKQLLFDDLEEIVLPGDVLVDADNRNIEAPQDPRFHIAKKMDTFLTKVADVGTFDATVELCSRIIAIH